MSAALCSAQISPEGIGLIAAHATGTPDNDAAEFAALSRVFGQHLPSIPVVGFKSHLGHTLGGAGAVEMILAMCAMREQIAPPCANVTAQEIEFPGLSVTTGQAKPAQIRATLSTSLGFGGANTCVILGPLPKLSAPSIHTNNPPRREVFITGIGVIIPGAIGNDPFLRALTSDTPHAWQMRSGAVPEEQFLHLLNARRVRRMSEQVKLTLAATAIACQHAGITDIPAFAQDCGAILASQHGSTHYSVSYYTEIVKQGLVAANPMLFAEGVPNACSAHLSLMLGVKGACQTIIGTRTAGLDALRLAALRISTGAWDRAIVGAAEEHSEVINSAYQSCGLCSAPEGGAPFVAETGFVAGSAAVTLILESRDSMQARSGKSHGRVFQGASARRQNDDPSAAPRQVLAQLDSPRQVISSANSTWIDRAELAAIRRAAPGALITSIYGHAAESFAAGPLLGLAAALLSQKVPRLRSSGLQDTSDFTPATGEEKATSIAALCTDYCGIASGIRIHVGND
jgi:3-oxoacyl-[acyl-carrier-protein] synthase II